MVSNIEEFAAGAAVRRTADNEIEVVGVDIPRSRPPVNDTRVVTSVGAVQG